MQISKIKYLLLTLNNYRCQLLLLAVILSFASCKKSFSSDQFLDDKLVVLAEITSGDSIEIPVGKTIKAGGGSLIRFEKVNDASVVLSPANASSLILQPSWSPIYASNPTTVFTNRKHFKPNTAYTLEINHPTLGQVKASTRIPALPKLLLIDTATQNFQGKEVLAVTIKWHDDGNTSNLYFIEALKELVKLNRYFYYGGIRYNYDNPQAQHLYERVKDLASVKLIRDTVAQNKFVRLYMYTRDNNSENSRIDNISHPFRRIFIPNTSFTGQIYSTTVFVDRQFLIAAEAKQRGRIRIQLKSASKELYDYLLEYEKYKTDFGTIPSTQLVSPTGNIQNGLGIFGGSSRRERILYLDTLR